MPIGMRDVAVAGVGCPAAADAPPIAPAPPALVASGVGGGGAPRCENVVIGIGPAPGATSPTFDEVKVKCEKFHWWKNSNVWHKATILKNSQHCCFLGPNWQ